MMQIQCTDVQWNGGGGGLTGHNRTKSCIANPYISKMGGFTCQLFGNVDMHTKCTYEKCLKKYHVVQEL